MRSLALAAAIGVAVLAGAVPSAASDAHAVVVVSAVFGPRSALNLSTEVLRFDVTAPDQPATVALDFSAAIRTRSGAEVVLSVEGLRALQGPGAADVETSLTFVGEGEGTLPGVIDPKALSIAGRWVGSGRRTGRLIFSLRAGAAGTYTVPVRFVLSTP
jgi:hypothetical protein